jgi:hypothetical protein
MSFRTHHRKLLLALEADEGVAETLDPTSDYIECIEPTYSITPRTFERNVTRKSITPAPIVTPGIGRAAGQPSATVEFSFQVELAGTGSATSLPRWSRILECCGFEKHAVGLVTIDTTPLAGAPNDPQVIKNGENLSVGTGDTAYNASNRIGRSVGDHFYGDRAIYYNAAGASGSGTSGDKLYGQIDDVNGTVQAFAAAVGYGFVPVSTDALGGANSTSATVALYMSNTGDYLEATGCRGNVEFVFASGDRVLMNITMMGVLNKYVSGSSDITIVGEGLSIPPGFVDVDLALGESTFGITDADDSTATVFNTMNINMGNEMTVRESVSASTGYAETVITGRSSSMTFNPDAVANLASNAQLDHWQRFLAGETFRGNFQVGSTAGNKFRFKFPAAQFTGIADGNRDEVTILDSTCTLTGGDYGSSVQEAVNDTGSTSTAISPRIGKDNEFVFYSL